MNLNNPPPLLHSSGCLSVIYLTEKTVIFNFNLIYFACGYLISLIQVMNHTSLTPTDKPPLISSVHRPVSESVH